MRAAHGQPYELSVPPVAQTLGRVLVRNHHTRTTLRVVRGTRRARTTLLVARATRSGGFDFVQAHLKLL